MQLSGWRQVGETNQRHASELVAILVLACHHGVPALVQAHDANIGETRRTVIMSCCDASRVQPNVQTVYSGSQSTSSIESSGVECDPSATTRNKQLVEWMKAIYIGIKST